MLRLFLVTLFFLCSFIKANEESVSSNLSDYISEECQEKDKEQCEVELEDSNSIYVVPSDLSKPDRKSVV